MEITNSNWTTFYIDESLIPPSIMAQVGALAMPIELYNLQQEKARLEAIPRIDDAYLLEWARVNCPEVSAQEANDKNLLDITTRINSWQQ